MKNILKKIKQRLPFDDFTYYENLLSSICYPDTNFIIKNKNLIKLYVLSQLANAIFRMVKNNDLTYKILYDITGEDIKTLIENEFLIEKKKTIISGLITKRVIFLQLIMKAFGNLKI